MYEAPAHCIGDNTVHVNDDIHPAFVGGIFQSSSLSGICARCCPPSRESGILYGVAHWITKYSGRGNVLLSIDLCVEAMQWTIPMFVCIS